MDRSLIDHHLVRVNEPGRTPLHVVVVGRLEIGRSGSGLILTDGGISRRHLVVEAHGDSVVVSDAGSSNGTTLDGATLHGPSRLEHGQVVRFGACSLELVATSPAASRSGSAAPVGSDLRATSIDVVAAAVLEDPAKAVREADAGTVSIVFTDIEASTTRAVELGDIRWMEVLGAHNSLIRSRTVRHGGREVKAQGDGFMLSFPSARKALTCLIEVQRALAAYGRSRPLEMVRVRAGCHTGEVILGDDGDLFGRHVMMAARIANVAHGGEILASSLVREIVDSRGDIQFAPARSVSLKGIEGSHLVHAVLWRESSGSAVASPGSP